MQCALKITCVFSVIIHQNIDPKSTENPATWRTARMHDFGISICCGQNHRLTPRSGGLDMCYMYCPFDHDRVWIRFFGRLGTARHFSRPNFCSGTRCAHQFWPQSARSAASAGARLAAGPAAGQAARARARIQQKSPRASSQISEFRSCMHSVSWIHA